MESEPKRIGDFFLELMDNPELQERYRHALKDVMAEWGLSEEQQELILRGNLKALRDAIQEEYGPGVTAILAFPLGGVQQMVTAAT